jgi:hypothetical protein
VTSFVFTGVNIGSQMDIITVTDTLVTNIWQASNLIYINTATQTLPNFALDTRGYAYCRRFCRDAF